jgi:hypothetical protein
MEMIHFDDRQPPLPQTDTEVMAVMVQREILDLPTLGKICGAICIVTLCGMFLLAPLALVLYLISWIGCR